MKINILGTEYTIEEKDRASEPYLLECDGFCDKTSKRIVITTRGQDCELDNFEPYRKQILRHEIIHAFLFESGLHHNWEHKPGHDETYVDWIAVQFPKLLMAFKAAGCIED